jgi:hypothetical protein
MKKLTIIWCVMAGMTWVGTSHAMAQARGAQPAPAQTANTTTNTTYRLDLGRLANGGTVAFVSAGSGEWGVETSGGAAPAMTQPKPAQIEVYRGDENVTELAAGYQSVQKVADALSRRQR